MSAFVYSGRPRRIDPARLRACVRACVRVFERVHLYKGFRHMRTGSKDECGEKGRERERERVCVCVCVCAAHGRTCAQVSSDVEVWDPPPAPGVQGRPAAAPQELAEKVWRASAGQVAGVCRLGASQPASRTRPRSAAAATRTTALGGWMGGNPPAGTPRVMCAPSRPRSASVYQHSALKAVRDGRASTASGLRGAPKSMQAML